MTRIWNIYNMFKCGASVITAMSPTIPTGTWTPADCTHSTPNRRVTSLVGIGYYKGKSESICKMFISFSATGPTAECTYNYKHRTSQLYWFLWLSPWVASTWDTLLITCTKEEKNAVIKFLWTEGVRGVEIHKRLSAQQGDSVLPCSEACISGMTY